MPKREADFLMCAPLQVCSVKVDISEGDGGGALWISSSGCVGEAMMAPGPMGPLGGYGRGGVRKYVGF
jgi:hypothetical protein